MSATIANAVPMIVLRLLALTLAGAVGAQASPPRPALYGLGRAKDGDSLKVGDQEVRLFGIDAPEFDQTCARNGQRWNCGSEAAERLSRLVTGREVRCVRVTVDQYERTVARCSVGVTDVNAAMVESGYATAYRQYSTDYVAAEARAKAARRGIWSGTFEAPRTYRLEERGLQQKSKARARVTTPLRAPGRFTNGAGRSACVIKGNRNRRGQWIYHVPGMPYYEQTRPEQLFCSEADARAAGYRRALVR